MRHANQSGFNEYTSQVKEIACLRRRKNLLMPRESYSLLIKKSSLSFLRYDELKTTARDPTKDKGEPMSKELSDRLYIA